MLIIQIELKTWKNHARNHPADPMMYCVRRSRSIRTQHSFYSLWSHIFLGLLVLRSLFPVFLSVSTWLLGCQLSVSLWYCCLLPYLLFKRQILMMIFVTQDGCGSPGWQLSGHVPVHANKTLYFCFVFFWQFASLNQRAIKGGKWATQPGEGFVAARNVHLNTVLCITSLIKMWTC